MTSFEVGYMVGSLARNSINRKLAKALVKLAPKELDMTRSGSGTYRFTAMTTTPTFLPPPALSRRRSPRSRPCCS